MTLLLPESVRARGNVRPADDVDFWSFTAAAGDRVYAATMALSSPTTGDTLLDVIAPDGTPQAATAGAAEARRRMVRSAPR